MVELLPFRGIFSHQEVELNHSPLNMGFPGGSDGEESVWRCGLNPWVRKIPWRKEWLPTPVFLPGRFHGQRNMAGYSP